MKKAKRKQEFLKRDRRKLVIDSRKALGLSRNDLGSEIGVSGRTIENWEQGRRVPGTPEIFGIFELMERKRSK